MSEEKTTGKQLSWGIFLTPRLIIEAIIALNFINYDAFKLVMGTAQNWILENLR